MKFNPVRSFRALSFRALGRANTIAAVACLVVAAVGVSATAQQTPDSDAAAYRTALAEAVRAAAEQTIDSVVTIEVVGAGDRAVGEVRQDAPTSGVIVDKDGHVLASSLVVRNPAASLLVRLPDGSRHAARVVARDRHRDLVLLKIDADRPLRAVRLAEKVVLRVGQTTIAVGRYGANAAPMVSSGVLSATGRLEGVALQTDARVSPALYGGPLIDLRGRVIGILIPAVAEGGAEDETAWYDSGIAFAIPSATVAAKLARLKSGEEIQKGVIGIVPKTRDPYAEDTTIGNVRLKSPAAEAGLKPGDRVVAVAGTSVRRHQEIKQALGPHDAGDTIYLAVLRDGERLEFEVTLTDSIPPLRPQRLGILAEEVQRADEEDGNDAAATGVLVEGVFPGTPAAGALQPGDSITRVGQAAVPDTLSLRRLMVAADPEAALAIGLQREGQAEEVTLQPASVGGAPLAVYPDRWSDRDEGAWSIEDFKLPDAANRAAVLGPDLDFGDGEPEVEATRGELGLLVWLLNPGEGEPDETLEGWKEAAAEAGVVVCAVAPQANRRWQPKEIDVISRMAAAVRKKFPLNPMALAVAAPGSVSGGDAEAADSMALAVAILSDQSFSGAAISQQTRPPAVRLPENDPSAALQLRLPIGESDELPGWGAALERRGYPIVRDDALDRERLLRWVRCLQAI